MKTSTIRIVLVTILFLASLNLALGLDYRTGLQIETEIPDWILPSPPIKLIGPIDEAWDNSEHLPPIGDQTPQGSCVGWAAGYYYKTYQEWEEHGWDVTSPNHQFSPAFVYNQINGGVDEGSYFSDSFKLLCDLGCATMEDMPYDPYNFTNLPDENDYYNGINYRCQQYYYIDLFSGLDDIKNHLLNGQVAMMGIFVWSNFQNIGNFNNTYCLSQVYGSEPGGHAVTLCGFDDDRVTADGVGAFKLANSWGTGWGEEGYFWMSYEAVQSDITSQGNAYYSVDLISYSPTLITRFQVSHDDRYAIEYRFGIGEPNLPSWSKDFFDWSMEPQGIVSYPVTNIVLDLTDGAGYLNPAGSNNLYMRCKDINTANGYDGEITYFSVEELTWPETAVSSDPPVAILDDGSYAYAELNLEGITQPPATLWTQTYGGNNTDHGYCVQQDSDESYVVAGVTMSYGAGSADVYLIKSDENGNELWYQTFGGSEFDSGHSIQQTSGGGYIITGWTYSFSVGSADVYLIKSDENGNELWCQTFGGSSWDGGYSVQQTSDGGYIIAGRTSSYGAGSGDVYLIKTDEEGNELWYQTFGGNNNDVGYSALQTMDGGYIIAGYTESFGAGDYDVYLIKTDASGNEQWYQTFGGTSEDVGYSVQQTMDGGHIIVGWTNYGDVYLIRLGYGGTFVSNSKQYKSSDFSLQVPYPNPFNPITNLTFSLPKSGRISLIVYNIQGCEVARLIDDWYLPGNHLVTFDASQLASGLYFARLIAGNFQQTQKLLLIK